VRIFDDCKKPAEVQDVADRSNGLGLTETGIGGIQVAYVHCTFESYFCKGRMTHKKDDG
jgi:hypothetical protein